jgi:ABC-type antimicrobial peptide transport system permease subunit
MAQRSEVMRLVLQHSVALTTVGIVVGLAGAMALTRYLRSMLFGLDPLDPPTFIGASVLFAVVAALASYVPTRRAMKVDPLVALRWE